jgi:hypothetical protein
MEGFAMIKKTAITVLIAAAIAIATGSITASAYEPPGNVSSVALFNVVGTEGGVYWRWGPHNAWNEAIAGYGEYDGYSIALDCWAFGDAVGPYGNTLWYFAEQYAPQPAVGDGQGWINDHYLDTPGTAAAPQPIGPRCPGY